MSEQDELQLKDELNGEWVKEWKEAVENIHTQWLRGQKRWTKKEWKSLHLQPELTEVNYASLERMLKLKPWGKQWREDYYFCRWGCHLVPKGEEAHAKNGLNLCPIHHRRLTGRIEDSKKNGKDKPRI